MTAERATEILRQSGLKATGHARVVLGILDRKGVPLSARDVHQALGKGACDLATVHRILGKCERAGLVRGITLQDRSRRFELVVAGSHHHHLVCTRCERIEPLSLCEIGRIQRRVWRETGFKATSHSLELFGLCRTCNGAGAGSRRA